MKQPLFVLLSTILGLHAAGCTSAPANDAGADAATTTDSAVSADVAGRCSPNWGGTWSGAQAVYTSTGAAPTTDMSSAGCPAMVTAVITQTGCDLSINVAGRTVTGPASQNERGTGMPLDHYISLSSPEFEFAMRFAPQDNVEMPDRNRLQFTQTMGGTSMSCFYAVTRTP